MSLRQKIENHFRNRSGQGSLVGVIVATVMLSMIVAAGTEWYLSMRKNIGNTEEKLEAQTIAMSEWERLSHMSLNELEASREALKKPYAAGQFTVSVNLGQKGTFSNGTCGAVTGGYANCFKDTTITVSRDGSRLFTTRTLPLMAGDYTRQEIDNLINNLKNSITQELNKAKLPIGTILPYKGALSSIPKGWKLCDGTNGTPNLKDRFLVGAGSSYNLGATGGENYHTLTKAELPSDMFSSSKNGYMVLGGQGYTWGNDRWGYKPSEFLSGHFIGDDGHDYYFGGGETHGGANEGYGGIVVTPINQWLMSLDGNKKAHENRPPYHAVYYIIRVS